MRRIVFDCDRCGRKDVNPIFSRYTHEGESEEHLLDRPSLLKQLVDHGFDREVLLDGVFGVVELMDKELDWKHFCDKCFGRLCMGLAQFMKIRRKPQELLAGPEDADLEDQQDDEDDYDEQDVPEEEEELGEEEEELEIAKPKRANGGEPVAINKEEQSAASIDPPLQSKPTKQPKPSKPRASAKKNEQPLG